MDGGQRPHVWAGRLELCGGSRRVGQRQNELATITDNRSGGVVMTAGGR